MYAPRCVKQSASASHSALAVTDSPIVHLSHRLS